MKESYLSDSEFLSISCWLTTLKFRSCFCLKDISFGGALGHIDNSQIVRITWASFEISHVVDHTLVYIYIYVGVLDSIYHIFLDSAS